ncbi:hypothetical protein D9M68_740350 [compost metagenome]
MPDQCGELVRTAKARREWHAGTERIAHLLRHARHHRRLEDARGNGHHPNAVARQFAGDRQGHADHAALRGGIGGLADLPVEGRHRGGVDDHAALAAGIGRVLLHGLGGQAQHIEGANQVDVDRPGEAVQAMHAATPEDLLGRRDAGTVDQAMHSAEGLQGDGNGLARLVFAADVGLGEACVGPQFCGARGPLLGIDIHQHDLAAGGEQALRGGQAKTRTAAGDQKYAILDTHVEAPLLRHQVEPDAQVVQLFRPRSSSG